MWLTKKDFAFLLCIINLKSLSCLENGLARTPPMGWLAWEVFKCNTNCDGDPKNCISENLFLEMADRLIKDGYRDAGYQYVNIDDCWQLHQRDDKGNMVADPERFPHGIKFISDYMHKRGLKMGIYQDFGYKTCMGYPGIVGHMEQDANAFAEWDADMVKLDGCNSGDLDLDQGYIHFGHLLNITKRPMLYSCSWPYYQIFKMNLEPKYELIAKHCNMWRNYHDIDVRWRRIEETIDFFADNQEVLGQFIGPGHWADADMILIGSPYLSPGQSRIQMAVWCVIPAPLLMSNDLRNIKSVFKEILLNKEAIAINQDRLGIPGKRILKENSFDIWVRKLSSDLENWFSFVVLFINTGNRAKRISDVPFTKFGIENGKKYKLIDIFEHKNFGVVHSNDTIELTVSKMDVTMLHFRLTSE